MISATTIIKQNLKHKGTFGSTLTKVTVLIVIYCFLIVCIVFNGIYGILWHTTFELGTEIATFILSSHFPPHLFSVNRWTHFES